MREVAQGRRGTGTQGPRTSRGPRPCGDPAPGPHALLQRGDPAPVPAEGSPTRGWRRPRRGAARGAGSGSGAVPAAPRRGGSAARRSGQTASRLPGSPGRGRAARPAAPPWPAPWACRALPPPAAPSLRQGAAPPRCSSPTSPRGPGNPGARNPAETCRRVRAPAYPKTHQDSLKPRLCSVSGRRIETLAPFISFS